MAGRALAAKVSTREPYVFSDAGRARIAVVDYGCKRSILNRLSWAGAAVTVYPHDVDADELAGYDGVLLSNGPGDPEPLEEEQVTLCNLVGRVPILGICLGHQLLALATGHQTYKLPFGHRGANHPVARARHGRRPRHQPEPRVRGRSQRGAGGDARLALRRNGRGPRLPASCARARSSSIPEAGPGPHDAWGLIDRWVEEVSEGLAKAA